MTATPPPSLVPLAGPNGAGKSTAGPALLKDTLGITEFVNADLIAQGISPFAPEAAAVTAGRVMLARLRELARRRVTFAFETTLSGRAYARWIADLRLSGYEFHLLFLWLRTPELAIQRVADRVRQGGHHVPDEVVRRRYNRGLRNFLRLYRPLATTWRLYDNSRSFTPRLVAAGGEGQESEVHDRTNWNAITGEARDEDGST